MCAITRACAYTGATWAWADTGAYALGPRVSRAGGLTHMSWYVGPGVGVQAVLGPVQRRFGFVLIQTGAASPFRRFSSEGQSRAGV